MSRTNKTCVDGTDAKNMEPQLVVYQTFVGRTGKRKYLKITTLQCNLECTPSAGCISDAKLLGESNSCEVKDDPICLDRTADHAGHANAMDAWTWCCDARHACRSGCTFSMTTPRPKGRGFTARLIIGMLIAHPAIKQGRPTGEHGGN